MQRFTVEFTIKPNGEVVEKVIEGSGEGCTEIVKSINDKIGAIKSQELLPEYYQESNEVLYRIRSRGN